MRDWKGLGWFMWEEENIAEKNKGEESEDGPIRGDVKEFLKVWRREPIGRAEYLGCGGVCKDDARDENGKVRRRKMIGYFEERIEKPQKESNDWRVTGMGGGRWRRRRGDWKGKEKGGRRLGVGRRKRISSSLPFPSLGMRRRWEVKIGDRREEIEGW